MRRTRATPALALLLLPTTLQDPGAGQEAGPLSLGPMLGAVTPESAVVWARAAMQGTHGLRVLDPRGREVFAGAAHADADSDLCMTWRIEGLAPATSYRYLITPEGGEKDAVAHGFATPPPHDRPRIARLAFGSCADDRRFPQQPIWTRIRESGAEAVVLLGDTPYIDSTELKVQRRRYREFYSLTELADLLPSVPFYCTWDDHDFGRNDTTGRLEGKQSSRRAFIEYHPAASFGEDGAAIYTSFRRGPLEVFLLDTRWFAAVGPSPFDEEQPTLLGAAQWKWLERRLVQSTAAFKVIACGMIWNGATRPLKTDHWMSYPHERQALFDLIGRKQVGGVVLVGGDIHRSRALRHSTEQSAGYDLVELITSPLSNFVIEAANQPHPGLLKDMGAAQSFLLLTADTTAAPATLTARFVDEKGATLYELQLGASELSRQR